MPDVEPAVQWAIGQVGTPYVSVGGSTPKVNLDCSGLTMRAFQQIGINMPHSTFEQIKWGTGVSKAELQRGDLIFPDPGHVQIYLGNNMIVESPHPGATVRVTTMWGFYAARRLGTASGKAPSNPGSGIAVNPVNLYDDIKKRIADIENIISGGQKAASWLSNSHNWFRILLVVGGAVMLILIAKHMAVGNLVS